MPKKIWSKPTCPVCGIPFSKHPEPICQRYRGITKERLEQEVMQEEAKEKQAKMLQSFYTPHPLGTTKSSTKSAISINRRNMPAVDRLKRRNLKPRSNRAQKKHGLKKASI